MASVAQYLMPRTAEIALARSAAPSAISDGAEVLVLTPKGYVTAAHGSNGFVCMVERAWSGGINDTDFWNPRVRGPLCLNPAAAHSYLPLTLMKSRLVLSGRNKTQMFAAIGAALDAKTLPPMEAGAMCYMLSKQGYLSQADDHWLPHLMFFVPLTKSSAWGANVPGSQVLGAPDPQDHLTIFMVPVARWSDGTVAAATGK
jgi:hypothetical protein